MVWVQNHPEEQAREMIPEDARSPDPDADLGAIRQIKHVMSNDGAIPADAAELVEKCVALSNQKVRSAHIDVSKIYTNEFLTHN
jgi:NitT/TauT family transport system substrate-binding protein